MFAGRYWGALARCTSPEQVKVRRTYVSHVHSLALGFMCAGTLTRNIAATHTALFTKVYELNMVVRMWVGPRPGQNGSPKLDSGCVIRIRSARAHKPQRWGASKGQHVWLRA